MNGESRIEYRPHGQQAQVSVELYRSLPDRLQWDKLGLGNQCLFVFDQNTEWFATRILDRMTREGFLVTPLALAIKSKDLVSITTIWSAMIETLPAFAVAVGGGSTCDLVAFASSCFRRGIPVILVPTTVLAMADACVSGKTGIDFGGIKNSLGTIHYPQLSYCVLEVLRTLEAAHFRAGLAEIVKVAVTSSSALFGHLEGCASWLSPMHPDLLDVVSVSCQLKAAIVEGDPMMRLHSMYGHVIGQAIESLNITEHRHGDCVAIGMGIEGHIAVRLGLWSSESWARQMNLLLSLGLPTQIPQGVTTSQLLTQVRKDKLATPQTVRMILPSGIGSVSSQNGDPRTEVPYDLLVSSLEEYAYITKSLLMQ